MQSDKINEALIESNHVCTEFKSYIQEHIIHLETFLKKFLEQATINSADTLVKSIHYSLFNGGKRIRPLWVYAIGESLDTPLKYLHAPAAAVELIHCFSLVHDDLPAMDNDDFRRGKPTCHKAFDEATAILCGDALQNLAFELLSDPIFNPIHPEKQIKMIQVLSKATGVQGMIGGQALDMMMTCSNTNSNANSNISDKLEWLKTLHMKKTGALITASILLGYYASKKYNACSLQQKSETTLLDHTDLYTQLRELGVLLGLSFQVQDDLLDVLGTFEDIGKTPGKDAKYEKLTFPNLLGLETSKRYKQELSEKAGNIISDLPINRSAHTILRKLANYCINRS